MLLYIKKIIFLSFSRILQSLCDLVLRRSSLEISLHEYVSLSLCIIVIFEQKLQLRIMANLRRCLCLSMFSCVAFCVLSGCQIRLFLARSYLVEIHVQNLFKINIKIFNLRLFNCRERINQQYRSKSLLRVNVIPW